MRSVLSVGWKGAVLEWSRGRGVPICALRGVEVAVRGAADPDRVPHRPDHHNTGQGGWKGREGGRSVLSVGWKFVSARVPLIQIVFKCKVQCDFLKPIRDHGSMGPCDHGTMEP